jgi:hypothetical protein
MKPDSRTRRYRCTENNFHPCISDGKLMCSVGGDLRLPSFPGDDGTVIAKSPGSMTRVFLYNPLVVIMSSCSFVRVETRNFTRSSGATQELEACECFLDQWTGAKIELTTRGVRSRSGSLPNQALPQATDILLSAAPRACTHLALHESVQLLQLPPMPWRFDTRSRMALLSVAMLFSRTVWNGNSEMEAV